MNEDTHDLITEYEEIRSLLWRLIHEYTGFRLDISKGMAVIEDIKAKRVPDAPEHPEGIAVIPNFKLNATAILYMLSIALGAKYGTDFGHWKGEGRLYFIWKVHTASTFRSMEYLERIIRGRSIARIMLQSWSYQLPFKPSTFIQRFNEAIYRRERLDARMKQDLVDAGLQRLEISKEEYEETLAEVDMSEEMTEIKERPGFDGIEFLRPDLLPREIS